jgi:hypothetical protein
MFQPLVLPLLAQVQVHFVILQQNIRSYSVAWVLVTGRMSHMPVKLFCFRVVSLSRLWITERTAGLDYYVIQITFLIIISNEVVR